MSLFLITFLRHGGKPEISPQQYGENLSSAPYFCHNYIMAVHLSLKELGVTEGRELITIEGGDPPVGLADVGISAMTSISPSAALGMKLDI